MNFYFESAKVLDQLDAKRGSIKGVIATLPEKSRKRTAAIVIETLKYKHVLNEVLDASKIMKEEKKLTSRNLALVLVHDLLLANGIQASEGAVKQAVLRHKTRLHSEFQRIKIKKGVKSTGDLARNGDERAANIPRYVRVNRTCYTTHEAVKEFISRGYELSDPIKNRKAFAKDEHIPDLLLFPPDTPFVDDPLYQSGKLILQDKASCFPAFVLDPPANEHSVVIDATAAPGNKTSHLCALMENKGKLYALERDKKRFETLKMMLSKARCKNVEPINIDFLTISPQDPTYSDVTHILLDPSCSGSGIVNRLDHLLESGAVRRSLTTSSSDEQTLMHDPPSVIEDQPEGEQELRLNKLAAFQLLMIKHAMKFPSVQRIVYSTCSVHTTENEHVVRNALRSEECSAGRFKLAPPEEVLPSWKRRGIQEELDHPSDATSIVRCSPGEDATNGFFVSLFVRDSPPRFVAHSDNRKRKEPEQGPGHGLPSENQAKRKKKRKKTRELIASD
ncbi:hypothetical protein NLI96_g7251 [Meripilus lineatus]|uniref:SAM-dependent MTase RsmB/NOP-type domain-containing protein n=1 Tax=Meripilus lineatus TaxID=2056292 RepID=A0AAD5UZJ5_9APHY|nr:hypothetical protein NLI96_g7251 [Physisporinus lineatus]